jgi:ribose/xylose/arabinose/galactoside ABC-type transport system permease subunit
VTAPSAGLSGMGCGEPPTLSAVAVRRLLRGAGLGPPLITSASSSRCRRHRQACPGAVSDGRAVICGAAAGVVHGFFFAKIGVPAFVVTLAGPLAWNGLTLYLLGFTGGVLLTAVAFDSLARRAAKARWRA